MQERSLVVSDDLLSRIDSLRGTKSREQFLELAMLLIAELDQVRGDEARLDFLLTAVERLQAHERRIGELMAVQGELLQALETALNPVPGAFAAVADSAPAADGQKLWQETAEPYQPGVMRPPQQLPAAQVEVLPPLPDVADDPALAEARNRKVFNNLWLAAGLLYGFGDTLLAYLVVNTPGAVPSGLAPFYQFGGMSAFIAGKTLLLAGVYALSVFVFSPERRSGRIVPAATTLVSAYLVLHNLVVLIRT